MDSIVLENLKDRLFDTYCLPNLKQSQIISLNRQTTLGDIKEMNKV